MRQSLRIAILGTRGIPAAYGGFETFASEISKRLVARGHQVTVFGRRAFFEEPSLNKFNGVTSKQSPTIFSKYLETPLAALSSMVSLKKKDEADVVLLCNAANSPFAWILRIRGIPVAINVDGIERHREKWNFIGKAWYRLGELCSVLFASKVIADAKVISDYYKEKFGISTEIIPYGAEEIGMPPGDILKKFGLKREQYLLYVSRLEPENNALGVVKAFRNVRTDYPLVIVGDAPYAKKYIDDLKKEADSRVVFTGYQFGNAYRELLSNAYLYIQATEVGGTHPALIEAMAHGNFIIANGTPENVEVLGSSGVIYPKNDFQELSSLLNHFINHSEEAEPFRLACRKRARELYSWESVTDLYEKLLISLIKTS